MRPVFARSIALRLCVSVALLAQGCAMFQAHAPGRAITPWEQVNVSNAQLAEANLAIARAVIAASDSGMIPLDLSNKILTAQSLIADKDRQLTQIFKDLSATPAPPPGSRSAEIQQLLAEIQKVAQELITDGLLGIKNEGTKQQVLSNLNSIFSLAQQLIAQLRAMGAVQ